jgi:hypothetical protein
VKYLPEERLEIGRRIYENELNRYQAAKEYGISEECARRYMRLYRNTNKPSLKRIRCGSIRRDEEEPHPVTTDPDLEKYESMTRKNLSGRLSGPRSGKHG